MHYLKCLPLKRKDTSPTLGVSVEKGKLGALSAGMETDIAAMETSTEVPQEIKNRAYHSTQRSHCWVYSQRKENQDIRNIQAFSNSLQHYSQ